jgi:hypothetical protein
MANVIRIKNSGTANSAPTSLELGELAINYADGKIFYKNSSNAVVEFGGSGGSGGVTVSDTPPSSPSAGDLWYESDTGKTFVYYDSFWVEVGAGSGVGLDSIVLGDDTTGNYVASLVAGTGVTLSNNSGEATTPTIAVDTSAIQVRVTNVSDTEIGYLDGVTSAIQTQIDAKANSNSSPVITLSGDLSGSATLTNLGNATITATIVANSVALGSDTSGDYVQSLVAGTGITLSNNSGEGTTPTVAVNTSTIATLASPVFTGDVTVSNNLIVSGNLTVSGSTTTVNTETVTIDDNIIVLNNNVTGSPTENAGVEIERGTSTNVQLRWNETTDKWQFTNDGTNFTDLGAGGATISETAPSAPEAGALWFNSNSAQTFVYYDSSWIEIGATAMGATVSTTAPNSPIGGQIWFNSDSGGTYVYYGTAWVEVGAAPVNVMLQAIDAKGDLLIGTADNTVGKVSVGSNSQLLRANSSTATGVEWFTPPYAPAASPTFTGTVVLPSDTSIGNVSSTEIGYVDGVTSAIQTQLDSKLTATTAITSNRNVIINGAMQVAQRGTTATGIAGGGAYVLADRWRFGGTLTTARFTATIEADYPSGYGFARSLKMLVTTAESSLNTGTNFPVDQLFEGQNLQQFAKGTALAKPFTLSFWVKSNVTGTYIARLLDSDNSRSCAASYTVNASATWEKKTITFPADTTGLLDNDNANSLRIQFYLCAGSTYTSGTLNTSWASSVNANIAVGQTNLASAINNYWQITGVQLEPGSVATPFEFEDYGTTLRKCQRYYYVHASGFGQAIAMASWYNSTNLNFVFQHPVTMRTTPSSVQTSGSNYYALEYGGTTVYTTGPFGLNSPSPNASRYYASGVSGGTTNAAGWIYTNDAGASIALSAEL